MRGDRAEASRPDLESLGKGKIPDFDDPVAEWERTETRLQTALEKAKRSQAEVSALLAATRGILNNQDFEPSARAIFDACKALTGARAGYVALLADDGEENEVLFLDAGGAPCTVDPSLPMPIRGLRSEAYYHRAVAYENEFWESDWVRFMPDGHVKLDNVLFSPLVVESQVPYGFAVGTHPGLEGFLIAVVCPMT